MESVSNYIRSHRQAFENDLSALLRTRAGGTFEPARHPFDTHAPQHRRAPRGDGRLTLENVDLKARELFVTGKGRRARALPLGPKAMKNLDRYLRARAHHKDAALPWLWLGPEGRLTESGIAQMIKRCSREAGLEPSVHPHQFRHTCSHQWLAAAERNTTSRRSTAGRACRWLVANAASAAAERARVAHQRISAGDKLR
jgi:hypothetical protein